MSVTLSSFHEELESQIFSNNETPSLFLFNRLVDSGFVKTSYDFQDSKVCISFDAGFFSATTCTSINARCNRDCAFSLSKKKTFDSYLEALLSNA